MNKFDEKEWKNGQKKMMKCPKVSAFWSYSVWRFSTESKKRGVLDGIFGRFSDGPKVREDFERDLFLFNRKKRT